ncbi:MAG TPA: alkaline phosphatase family protein [Tepidisphaeraceae bacterium]|nr:alkaline phosphatase family protein [Tepidisphaeraceae bacterium]
MIYRILRSYVLFLLLSGAALAQNVPARHRVLIISVDGLRPDVMLRANAPILHGLLERGSFTMWAQTTAVSVTLPSHVSMLTGARPQIHQIEWNHDLPLSEPIYPKVPTLFELAHKAGYTTGMVAGKDKFAVLNKPGTIDSVFIPKEDAIPDEQVLEQAMKVIEYGPPQVLFIHLPQVDHVGHALGWGSSEQLAAIAYADSCIGKILDAIRAKDGDDDRLTIISADHGGAGKNHGADDVRSRNIPWIAVGATVRRGLDLTSYENLTIRTEDTFATACYWLDLKPQAGLDGKPVLQVFEPKDQQLLTDTSSPATQPVASSARSEQK